MVMNKVRMEASEEVVAEATAVAEDDRVDEMKEHELREGLFTLYSSCREELTAHFEDLKAQQLAELSAHFDELKNGMESPDQARAESQIVREGCHPSTARVVAGPQSVRCSNNILF